MYTITTVPVSTLILIMFLDCKTEDEIILMFHLCGHLWLCKWSASLFHS